MASTQRKRVVKIFVSDDEADRIRLAAAIRRESMGEFIRDVVMQEAQKLTAKIELAPGSSKPR